ncbi:MAG: glutathione binding-like protein [Reyranellaceae bacterium]
MELFYAPFACSLAAHIVCREAGLPVTLRRVTLSTKELESGGSLYDLNPKGAVPTLRRDDGSVLSENAAVLQYLGDRVPASGLCPPAGADERYRLAEWLSFIGTELHKRVFYMMFTPESDVAAKEAARAAAPKRLAVVAQALQGRDWLVGDTFTVADAYLFWWLSLAPRVGIDIAAHPGLEAYVARCTARPAVRAAVELETAQRGT